MFLKDDIIRAFFETNEHGSKNVVIKIGMLLLACLIFMCSITISVASANVSNDQKRILYISSYYEGYKWSDDIRDGIYSVVFQSNLDVDLKVEYLDMQHIDDSSYYEKIYRIYSEKYGSNDFDIIITSDDKAYEFVRLYGKELFSDTIKLYCGVNNVDTIHDNQGIYYDGIIEAYDFSETIDLALNLHPSTTKIYYVNDTSLTGTSIQKNLTEIMLEYKDIDFQRLQPYVANGVLQIEELDDDSIILFVRYTKDANGNDFVYNEVLNHLQQNVSVPIYSVWDFYLGEGIVGGKLTSGYYHGVTIAEAAMELLHGNMKDFQAIMRTHENQYRFDYDFLAKHNIPLYKLPSDSYIINYSPTNTKHVLVLHSYNRGFLWTDDIDRGIHASMDDVEYDVKYTHEYMDLKDYHDPTYKQSVYQFLYDKYESKSFDMIITSDDDAFKFVKQYHSQLFEHTPVIFCGVNRFEEGMLDEQDCFSGVVENLESEETFQLMLELFPETEKIIVINDTTTTGLLLKKNIDAVIDTFDYDVTFEYWEDINMTDIQERGPLIGENTLVYIIIFNKDKSNNNYTYDESIRLISEAIDVPIFSTVDFYIGKGIFGGKLTSGFTQGNKAGEMAKEILEGKSVEEIPIIFDLSNDYIFDYNELEKFNIKRNSLPENSIIVNKPYSINDYYEAHKSAVQIGLMIIMLILIFSLTTISILLRRNLKIKTESIEQEKFYASTDILTGVKNRRIGLKELKDAIEQNKSGIPFSICFVDMDYLKKINDTYGHDEGDFAIKTICECCINQVGPNDVISRIGGDEFLMVLPKRTVDEAQKVIENIKVSLNRINNSNSKPYELSISSGVLEYDAKEYKTAEDFIKAADELMYCNKAEKKRRKTD